MEPRWTLYVRDFGRIKAADIKVAPMMIFVGPNNSGKSYISSLLWGLSELREGPFVTEKPAMDAGGECKRLIEEFYEKKESRISRSLIQSLLDLFNVHLKDLKEMLVKRIFSSEDIRIGEIFFPSMKNGCLLIPLNGCQMIVSKSFTDLIPLYSPYPIFLMIKLRINFYRSLSDGFCSMKSIVLFIFPLPEPDSCSLTRP